MDIINYQSNGAKGLRTAASVCIILGWIALFVSFIFACANADKIIFIIPILAGAIALGAMYLLAFAIQALASLSEAAQLYYNINAPVEEYEDE